jgi:dCMP deaminase
MMSVLSPDTAEAVAFDYADMLRRCYLFSTLVSDDPSTQNGAIIVDLSGPISCGANHFPLGVHKTPERLVRPTKYAYMEHAERAAIYNAARYGKATEGCWMFCPWSACADCARAIVEAGIERLIRHKSILDKTGDRWKESVAIADQILTEGHVEIENYEGEIGGVTILFDGEPWNP